MAAAISLATYFYNSILGSSSSNGPVLQISTGLIKGKQANSRNGKDYSEFLGIPFAKPPVGDLRFEDPQPPESWNGIRNAQHFAPECMQLEAMVTGRIQGEEDCLYLNVYTPMVVHKSLIKLLPVMVFFHGGLFISGGSHIYGSKYLIDEGVVLIVPQYRLGALGFLNSGDGVVSGNMGLKDQTLSLKWIQQNIKQFGGDPDSVTLFGNSAGGSSVHFHMLSPFSKGLFHRGISESGTVLQIWTLSKYPTEQSRKFATQMHCPTHDTKAMVNCLKKLDASELVKPHIDTMSAIRLNTDLFVPTVDGNFIPDQPENMLNTGNFQKIPWLTGVNAGEGLLNTGRIVASERIFKNLGKAWNQWMPIMLDYDERRTDISTKIRNYYFGNFRGKYLAEDTENLTNIYSDRVYFHATRKAALYHARYAPTYLYYYSYPGEFSFFSLFKAVMPRHEDYFAPEFKIAVDVAKDLFQKYVMGSSQQNLGPCHADELPMLFNIHKVVEVTRGAKDFLVSRSLVKVWTDFAKQVQPLKYQNIAWPLVNVLNGVQKYMNIDRRGGVIDEPFKNRMDFWDSLQL